MFICHSYLAFPSYNESCKNAILGEYFIKSNSKTFFITMSHAHFYGSNEHTSIQNRHWPKSCKYTQKLF